MLLLLQSHFYNVVVTNVVPEARIALLRLRNKHVTKELDSCGAHIKQLTLMSNELAKQYQELKNNPEADPAHMREVKAAYMEHYKELGYFIDIRKPMLRETSYVRAELRQYDRDIQSQVRGLSSAMCLEVCCSISESS